MKEGHTLVHAISAGAFFVAEHAMKTFAISRVLPPWPNVIFRRLDHRCRHLNLKRKENVIPHVGCTLTIEILIGIWIGVIEYRYYYCDIVSTYCAEDIRDRNKVFGYK